MGKRRKDSEVGMFWFIFIVGGSAFLIMTQPRLFFLLVLPVTFLLIIAFIAWLKK